MRSRYRHDQRKFQYNRAIQVHEKSLMRHFKLGRILSSILQSKHEEESLGKGMAPGTMHYRAFVGPPDEYDLVSAMTFSLLVTLGLRQYHVLLDIGCGSLRIGRLLIPYLARGNYLGIEPNRWLVEEGIRRETGRALIEIKRPTFIFGESLENAEVPSIDFALAQSIFSHCGKDLLSRWLQHISACLRPTGALVATFVEGGHAATTEGWIYPECVAYHPKEVAEVASEAGLACEILDWAHPRQTWALFSKPDFCKGWISKQGLTWNGMMRARKEGQILER